MLRMENVWTPLRYRFYIVSVHCDKKLTSRRMNECGYESANVCRDRVPYRSWCMVVRHHYCPQENDFTRRRQLQGPWGAECRARAGEGKQLCRLDGADKEPTNCSQSERGRRWRQQRSAWNRYKRVDGMIWTLFAEEMEEMSVGRGAYRMGCVSRGSPPNIGWVGHSANGPNNWPTSIAFKYIINTDNVTYSLER